LLLVTIGLVIVGAVSLVIGFVSNSLAPIYISIACSVIAGAVLVVFSQMSRRKAAEVPGGAATGPAPLATDTTSAVTAGEPTMATTAAAVEEHVGEAQAAAAAPVAAAPAADVFPIEDYDSLRVNQILPLLDELDLDELDFVREREEPGKNRTTIIKRVDELIDELEAEEPAAASVAAVAEAPSPAAVAEAVAAPVAAPSTEGFPIADYDDLSVAEILPLLDELDDDELEMVAEREEQGKNRQTIIKRIDAIFEEPLPVAAEEAAAAPVEEAPVKKAVKKAAAKKAAPAKKATAVKKAAAKKAAPAKAAAPAKKAAAKKAAPAKAAPAAKKATKKAAKKRA
jgi:hypothetical protein